MRRRPHSWRSEGGERGEGASPPPTSGSCEDKGTRGKVLSTGHII